MNLCANIVFSNSRQRALEKLEEICEEKTNLLVKIKYNESDLKYIFKDEIWIWKRPDYHVRGYRYEKCWIDEGNITLKQFKEIILPRCIHINDESINYF